MRAVHLAPMTVLLVLAASLAGGSPAARGVEGEADPREARSSRRAQQELERDRRLMAQLLDDLAVAAARTQEEIVALERRIDAILPLESPRRETGLRELAAIYQQHLDRLELARAAVEDDLVMPADLQPAAAALADRYENLATVDRQAAGRLKAWVKGVDRELQRLTQLVDRKQYLADHLADLDARLVGIEERLAGNGKTEGKRATDERKRDELRRRVVIVQDELRSLSDVDEGLLKHYVVLIEWGGLEREWLARDAERADALRGAVAAGGTKADTSRRIRAVIRLCESQIEGLRRARNELDRRQEQVSPAGSLRDLDRSRELADLYGRFADRYEREIVRLQVRIGALEAERSERPVGKGE